MWQTLGLSFFLLLLSLLQLLLPPFLPGHLPFPDLLLVAAVLVLTVLPRKRLFFLLLLLAACADLLLDSSPQNLLAYGVALSLPLLNSRSKQVKTGPMLLQVGLAVILREGVFWLFSLRYGLAGSALLLQDLLPYLLVNLLLALLLRPLIEALMRLLHYQQFEYLDEVMKGKLG